MQKRKINKNSSWYSEIALGSLNMKIGRNSSYTAEETITKENIKYLTALTLALLPIKEFVGELLVALGLLLNEMIAQLMSILTSELAPEFTSFIILLITLWIQK